jgi:hypothetical protein
MFPYKPNENFDINKSKIEWGLQMRFGSYNGGCSLSEKIFCNQDGLNKFYEIIKKNNKVFYIASDNASVKNELKKKVKDNIIIIDYTVEHPRNSSSEMNYFTISELINLSKCSKLFLTGGSINESESVQSTFGIVSSLLNNVEYEWIYNNN